MCKGRRAGALSLFAKTELRDQVDVALLVAASKIIEQRTALVDEHQKTAARMIVLRVGLEMLGEIVDSFGQDRDLDLGRTRVPLAASMILDERLFALRGNRHRQHSCHFKG